MRVEENSRKMTGQDKGSPTPEYGDLKEKVVLVTGGSGGLGSEMVRAFHLQGCKVALNYHSAKDQAESIASKLGKNVHPFLADVADRDQVRKMVKEVDKKFGPVNILVNNAGLSFPMEFENVDFSKFDYMWRVNTLGVIHVSLEVLPGMKRTKNGAILNIASHSGLGNPRPKATYYAVTKAAVITLTKRMALELGKKYGIRVNCIAPGMIFVDPKGIRMSAREAQEYEERLGMKRILGLKGLSRHISDIALFLSSKSSEFMTGQVIVADGGRLDSLPRSV